MGLLLLFSVPSTVGAVCGGAGYTVRPRASAISRRGRQPRSRVSGQPASSGCPASGARCVTSLEDDNINRLYTRTSPMYSRLCKSYL